MKRKKLSRSEKRPLYRPRLELLEGRELPSSTSIWPMLSGNAQHTAEYTAGAVPQLLDPTIKWSTPVDYDPTYSGSELLIHYGEPLVTEANEIIVPAKTDATGDFEVEGHNAATGNFDWSASSDYILPPEPPGTWTPSFGPALAILPSATERLYFPGAGGTVYYIDNPDSADGAITGQIAFYGTAAYQEFGATFANDVYIDTPITADSSGNIYFGFYATPGNPFGLSSGIARIDSSGNGSWISAAAASANANMLKVVSNCAPALSNDGSTLYFTVSSANGYSTGYGYGYLVAVNSSTLAPISSVLLTDPASGSNAFLTDDGTASPVVGPNGNVFIGVLESGYFVGQYSHNGRGWLLQFSSNLGTESTPGSFGWDDTPTIIPSSWVPSYTGTSSYLIFAKYNNYIGAGSGNGNNQIAILDPTAKQNDPIDGASVKVMKQVAVANSPTTSSEGGYTEWCINSAVVVPPTSGIDGQIFANNEDGTLFRWDLGTASTAPKLYSVMNLTTGIGEAYTPTFVDNSGAIYAISDATLYCIGEPEISIDNTIVRESNTGTTYAVFTISVSGYYNHQILVNFSTVDGTFSSALQGSYLPGIGTADNLGYADYNSLPNVTVKLLPGQLSTTISIPIRRDPNHIGNKFFDVVLNYAEDAYNSLFLPFASSVGVAEILDDRIIPGISVSNAAVYPQSGGGSTVYDVFDVALTDATANPVSVSYVTQNNSAVAGVQYQATSGTITFSPGQTEQQIYVPVNGSLLSEPDTDFFLDLGTPVNAILDTNPSATIEQGLGYILNDQNTVSINSPSVVDGAGPTSTATFTVSLNAAAAFPIYLNYISVDGSALGGQDYVPVQGTLTIPAGQTSATISVTLLTNGDYKPTENFSVVLSSFAGSNVLITQGTGTATITSVAPPTISINSVEGENGTTGTMTGYSFTVTLSAPSDVPVSVDYTTHDGTAKAGTDYVGVYNQVLTIPAGQTTATIPVTVDGHTGTLDNQLTFTMVLSNPANCSIGTGTGTFTLDNEWPGPLVSITNNGPIYDGAKTTMKFTVTLSKGHTNTVTVQYTTVDGSAVAGTNYTAASGTLTFASGVLNQSFNVTINKNTTPGPDTSFSVQLSSPVNAYFPSSATNISSTGTIKNGDSLLSSTAVSVTDGTSGVTNMVFTVTLSSPPSVPVTVNYASSSGTASAGSDYAPVSGTLTFPVGTTSETITVPIFGEYLANNVARTLTITLSSPINAMISTATAIGTINFTPETADVAFTSFLGVDGTSNYRVFYFAIGLVDPNTGNAIASNQAITLDVSTANGGGTGPAAQAGIDYVAGSGKVTFAVGQTSALIAIVVYGTITPTAVPYDQFSVFAALDPSSAGTATIIGSALGTIVTDDWTTTPPT